MATTAFDEYDSQAETLYDPIESESLTDMLKPTEDVPMYLVQLPQNPTSAEILQRKGHVASFSAFKDGDKRPPRSRSLPAPRADRKRVSSSVSMASPPPKKSLRRTSSNAHGSNQLWQCNTCAHIYVQPKSPTCDHCDDGVVSKMGAYS